MGQPAKKSIVWGGRRWWLNGGYYCNREGRMLHRAVYVAAYGPIPKGYDVHHKDEDKTNNAPSNLEALTRAEHLKRHRARGIAVWPKEKRSQKTLEQWQAREPYDKACDQCGAIFQTTGTRSRFCSKSCGHRYRWANQERRPERRCAYCGKTFRSLKTSRLFCTSSCSQEAKRRPLRACAVCGEAFRNPDPRPICCSLECGYAYRRRGWAARRKSPGL